MNQKRRKIFDVIFPALQEETCGINVTETILA